MQVLPGEGGDEIPLAAATSWDEMKTALSAWADSRRSDQSRMA
jgi:hypothetical protein